MYKSTFGSGTVEHNREEIAAVAAVAAPKKGSTLVALSNCSCGLCLLFAQSLHYKKGIPEHKKVDLLIPF